MPIIEVMLLQPVTLHGCIIEAGEAVKLSHKSATALVNEGIAEYVPNQTNATVDETNENEDSNTTDTQTENEGAKDEIDALEKTRKEIDDRFTRDPLAEAAKRLGVEFAYNAKKGEIIDAIIEAGKAEALLQS